MKKPLGQIKFFEEFLKKHKFGLLFIFISLIAIFLCLLPAIKSNNWPTDANFTIITRIQAEHFKQGDLFPIWSANDSFGAGSPLPLYYHKTFYYVAGFILLLTSSVRITLLLSIAVFMLVGVYGMRKCLRLLTRNKLMLLLAPQTLLFANYTFTDLLMRDDMAEFAAMMIVPWLVWWCLNLLQKRKFSLSIVPILFLLLNAHNIFGLFGVIIPATAYCVYLIQEKREGLRQTILPLLKSIGLFLLLMLPLLVIEKLFLQSYDPSKVTQNGYFASNHFHPLSGYLYRSHFWWFNDKGHLTLQLDFGLSIPMYITAVGASIGLFFGRSRKWMKKNFRSNILIFLIASLSIYCFLQLRISKPLYTHLHFMEYLQFPWRLVGYITIALILVVAFLITRIKNTRIINILVVVWLFGFILLSPAFKRLGRTYPRPEKFTYTVPSGESAGFSALFGGIGEYLPRVYDASGEISSLNTIPIVFAHHDTEVLTGGPCKTVQILPTKYEELTLFIRVHCDKFAQIALPVSYNEYTQITDTNTNKTVTFTRTNKADPRIILDIPAGADMNLRIRLPTVPRILQKIL